ncbi:MAG: hypothetical protein WBW90_09770 [Candidatus Acidiferrum sp.]
MITAEHFSTIGTGPTDPGRKSDPQMAQLQAIVNLTDGRLSD